MGLPETLLRSKESADAACIRLIDDKIGLKSSDEFNRTTGHLYRSQAGYGNSGTGTRYMTYLPSTPKLHPGYGATDAQWFVLDKDQGNYVITHDQQEIILSPAGHLVFDHIQIITTAINRIKNKLDYQPKFFGS